MAYYTPEEMEQLFLLYPQYKSRLYNRGFLITTHKLDLGDFYPFYGNWSENEIASSSISYYFYTHYETTVYQFNDGDCIHFLIGHAYDPYSMEIDENVILRRLSSALKSGSEKYWDEESNLTGVFCVGYISKDGVVFSTDCCGMQLVNYGVIQNNLYVTSHSKLVADLLGLKQTEYIRRLVANRFWHYFGQWLPGDLTPFAELKRMQPNFSVQFSTERKTLKLERYYPLEKVEETTTEEEYTRTIHELAKIMSNTMDCIARKWAGKKVSISVTGGRDSMTTLSCSRDHYDDFSYFSYISNVDESVDADAARGILSNLGLPHEVFKIPDQREEYQNLDAFKKIMECNAGCIGSNKLNDVKKRLYLWRNPPCDMEVKSWVNEMGRGRYYDRYQKKSFPKSPKASCLRTIHKVLLSPWLIKKTDQVFNQFLQVYGDKKAFENIFWLDLFYWEFSWSGGEGLFLTAEHRVSYDITIPFNNRKYIEKMLTVPLKKRKVDAIPNSIIHLMEPRIEQTGIKVKDISHTKKRSIIERTYFEIFSRIHIWF